MSLAFNRTRLNGLKVRVFGLAFASSLVLGSAGVPAVHAAGLPTHLLWLPCSPPALLTPKLGLDANNVVGTGQCFTPGGKVRVELKDNQGLIKKHMYVTATPAWKCDFPDQCVPTFDGGKISYDFEGAYLPVTNWLYCLAPASGSHLEVIARDESSGKVVSLQAC